MISVAMKEFAPVTTAVAVPTICTVNAFMYEGFVDFASAKSKRNSWYHAPVVFGTHCVHSNYTGSSATRHVNTSLQKQSVVSKASAISHLEFLR